MTGWEESCLSACLSVFQVEAGGGTSREVEAASLVRISNFHSWATLRHTPNTDARPGFRPLGRHLRLHRLHGDMRTQGHTCAGTQQRMEQAYVPPPHTHTHTHPREPDTHVPSHPAVQRGQKTGTRARRPLSPQPGARARQPSGSVPSWSLSREAQCVISKQKESSSFPAGRKSRVWGWVGGRVGMCKGAGRVCWGNRHVSTDRAVCLCVPGLGTRGLGALRLGGGRSRGNSVSL